MHNSFDPEKEKQLLKTTAINPSAFRELYQHYLPRVYAYVSYRVGRVSDTEDLVSDIFLRVVERLDSFEWRGAGSFAAWLFRIAHNRVGDYYRQSQRDNQQVTWDELPEIENNSPLPSEAILQKERFAHLRQLIASLSPRRQEIITLKFFGGLRNQEIATLLNLDERTVASHLSRGLVDLQRCYLATTKKEQQS